MKVRPVTFQNLVFLDKMGESGEMGNRGTAATLNVFPSGGGSVGMDQLREFLNAVRDSGAASGNFLGLLNVLIGRRITRTDGTAVSGGMTWRELSALLKQLRWDRDVLRELKLDLAALPPRDRERFWYVAIARTDIASAAATAAGDRLIKPLKALGYVVGPAPGTKPTGS
jgi:hypothetical protein